MISRIWILFVVICFSSFSSRADTVTLIDEDFSTGTGLVTGTTTWSNNSLDWIWSRKSSSGVSPTGTEVYTPAGSSARGLPSTHGGFEVFSIGASQPSSGTIWQVAVRVVLPTNYPEVWNGNTISFDMGYRSAISPSSGFELYNITDSRSIVSESITGRLNAWKNVTFNPTFLSSDAGDTVELRWWDTSTGRDDRSLEVGAVVFNVIPEPSALSLLAVGLGGLAILRRRRS